MKAHIKYEIRENPVKWTFKYSAISFLEAAVVDGMIVKDYENRTGSPKVKFELDIP